MSLNDFKKWLAIGTGVGIEIDASDLEITLVRVRPTGARVVGTLTVERYAERPAAEWGAEYGAFLKQHGGSHLAATVLLPRRDVIVRQVAVPGVTERDLPQAVRFQIDGLHPYADDETVYDYAPIAATGNVLVGIAKRDAIDRYVALFAEAGIKVSSFTFSAAVLYSALRLFGIPPAPGFLTVDEHDGVLEAYGESEARPVFTATFEAPNEQFAARARELAVSELRLDPDTIPQRVDTVLPAPVSAPDGFDIVPLSMTYATALAGACPRLALRANLLPPELRTTSSRAMYIPSIVLGTLLLLSAGGLALYGSWEDRKYSEALQAEIKRLRPTAEKPQALDRAITVARQRAQLLDAFRKRTQADLDVVNELTRLLEPPGWLNAADISRDQIRISGEAAQGVGLLHALDKSPLFEASEFSLPLARTATGEVFSIRSRREGALP